MSMAQNSCMTSPSSLTLTCVARSSLRGCCPDTLMASLTSTLFVSARGFRWGNAFCFYPSAWSWEFNFYLSAGSCGFNFDLSAWSWWFNFCFTCLLEAGGSTFAFTCLLEAGGSTFAFTCLLEAGGSTFAFIRLLEAGGLTQVWLCALCMQLCSCIFAGGICWQSSQAAVFYLPRKLILRNRGQWRLDHLWVFLLPNIILLHHLCCAHGP